MTEAAPRAAIVVERTYRATPHELWDLWTTKEGFESWWGPEGFRVEVHALEARAGGALSYDMIADTPETIAAMEAGGHPPTHATHGWYGEFEPHRRVSLLHTIDFLPGVTPYDVAIEVAFIPAGDQTRMVVTLHPHLDPQWTRASAEGFASQLTKLDRRYGWKP